jgi:hypothetical protein
MSRDADHIGLALSHYVNLVCHRPDVGEHPLSALGNHVQRNQFNVGGSLSIRIG